MKLIKFTVAGGTTWVIDTTVFLLLRRTLLIEKPLTAKVIAVILATVASYGLNGSGRSASAVGPELHHT